MFRNQNTLVGNPLSFDKQTHKFEEQILIFYIPVCFFIVISLIASFISLKSSQSLHFSMQILISLSLQHS